MIKIDIYKIYLVLLYRNTSFCIIRFFYINVLCREFLRYVVIIKLLSILSVSSTLIKDAIDVYREDILINKFHAIISNDPH